MPWRAFSFKPRSTCLAFSLDWYSSNSAMICRIMTCMGSLSPFPIGATLDHTPGRHQARHAAEISIAQRQIVQHPPHLPPPWHALIEQSEKLCRVRALAEMGKLMQHDVVKALGRLLSQVGVEVDVAGERVAASPLGLHPLHEHLPGDDA